MPSYEAGRGPMQKGIFVGSLVWSSVLGVGGCGEQQPPAPPPPAVGVVKLSVENAPLTAELPGRIAAVETAEVRPQLNGVIRRRLFTERALVRAGHLLYQIEDPPSRVDVDQAPGALGRAQASFRASALPAPATSEQARSRE